MGRPRTNKVRMESRKLPLPFIKSVKIISSIEGKTQKDFLMDLSDELLKDIQGRGIKKDEKKSLFPRI